MGLDLIYDMIEHLKEKIKIQQRQIVTVEKIN